jgi:signal transduction histidine kinase/ActR/RegA family two-component response regulator
VSKRVVVPDLALAAFFCGAAAALLLAFLLAVTDAVGRGALSVVLAVVVAFAAAICAIKTWRTPSERAIWAILGVGEVSWGVGAVACLAQHDATKFPSVGNLILVTLPLTTAGFVLLASRRLSGLPRALWLDAALAGIALAAVGAMVLYEPWLDGSFSQSFAASAFAIALTELAKLGFTGVACVFAGALRPRPLMFLVGSSLAAAVATGALAVAADDGWRSAPPLVAVGMVAALVIASGAAVFDDGRRYSIAEPSWSLITVPIVAALAAIAVGLSTPHAHTVAVYLAYLVLLLAVARLAVSLIDNRRAYERERRDDRDRHAREEAERANLEKTKFLSKMSHEVRTPLTSILGFAQLLVDDLEGDERVSVERILRAGQYLQRLIDDILDLSTIEAGETPLSLEPTPLDPAIEEAIALLEPLAQSSDVRVVRDDADDAPPAVIADPRRLRQVLINLISNAIKYGGSGEDVVVRVERDGPRGVIKVIDVGAGIPDEDLPLLFTPFERGSARRSDIEGSGLGLALTKNLVEAMRGSIGVQTGPGGSTFYVSFPPAEALPLEEVADVDDGARHELAASGETRTVLYIEDNLSNIELVERLLGRRPGFELLTATTGRAGLELAREVHPDLVLLDLDLPDIRGEEVLAELRGQPETADIPVIIVTADAAPWRQAELARAGADAYVVKPIQLASFLETLEAVLRRVEATRR